MRVPEVTREEVLEAVRQLPPEVLPEVAKFIEFVQYKTSLSSADVLAQIAEVARIAFINALAAKYADVPTSSEQFARRKQEEIDLEEKSSCF
jgi:myo-inositol-1-phosphate synthase